MTTDAASPTRSGLTVVWETIVAPKTAFAALRERAHWLWAFATVCVLGMLGAYLQVPAGEHVVAATFAHNAATDPNIAALSPEKQRQALGFAVAAQRFAWLAFPVIAIFGIACSALILTIANAIGRGRSSYPRLFALVANIAVIHYGMAYLLIGLLVTRLGPDAFSTPRDLFALLPSLARFAPENAPKLAALLAAFNPFQLWSFALTVLGLRMLSGIRMELALVAAAVVGFGSSAIAASLAK